MTDTRSSGKSPGKSPAKSAGVTRRTALALTGAAIAAPVVLRHAHAAEVTLKLSHMLPPVSLAHRRMFQPWAEKVKKESDGRIDVQIFPSMSLGGRPPDLVDQARDGIAELSWALPTYHAGRFPILETWTLPFMITNAEQTSQAIDEYVRTHGGKEWADVQPLAWWCHGPGLFMTKGKRIEKMEDLKGVRIRGGNQVIVRALELLGASAQFYPVPEVPSQLSKGVSDGVTLPYEIVPAFKLHELLDHFAEMEKGVRQFYTIPFGFLMNKRRYESLPDDLRKVIDDNSGPALSRKFGADFDFGDKYGRGLVEKADRTFTTISAEEVGRWQKTVAPLTESWIGELDKRDLDGKKLVEAANTLLDKYAKSS